MSAKLIIDKTVSIPLSELKFRFSRSGGRGGQNVNKLETRVELIFNIRNSDSFTEEQRLTALHYLRPRIDAEGNLRIIAQSSRYQWRNRQEAVEKFIALLQKAFLPRKKRVATKATTSSNQKRLDAKKRRSRIKLSRTTKEE